MYTTKATTVGEALHFVAVDLKSNLLQMQSTIGETIYKDDARVEAKLQILLDLVEEGFAYFVAASAHEYVECVKEKLEKLYDKVRGGGKNLW